jgi:hypothetical protein
LSPEDDFCPLGVKFSVCFTNLLNNRVHSPLGVKKGVNIPLGAKFTPRGEVIPCEPGVKFRMAL